MDCKNGNDDVSSFFLFEASGDSEADSNSSLNAMCHDIAIAGCDDDAESCSCDSSDTIINFHEVSSDCDDQDFSDSDDDYDDDDDDSNGANDRKRRRTRQKMGLPDAAAATGFVSREEGEVESRVVVDVDASREMMDEMENRLFWETCLEVGYP